MRLATLGPVGMRDLYIKHHIRELPELNVFNVLKTTGTLVLTLSGITTTGVANETNGNCR